jgi:hypothetical protein
MCWSHCLLACWSYKGALVQLGAILAHSEANVAFSIRLESTSLPKLFRSVLVIERDLEGRLVGRMQGLIERFSSGGLLMSVDCIFLVSACCEHGEY